MCERILVLYRNHLFGDALRHILSVEPCFDTHVAALDDANCVDIVASVAPDVVVLERLEGAVDDPILSDILRRVRRVIMLGLSDSSLQCMTGITVGSAGPDDLVQLLRASSCTPQRAAWHADSATVAELRWHGRGGQGAVTAAKTLAAAALRDGRYVQAFPEYGPERRGAPLTAFTRLAREPITLFTPVGAPDAVVLLDATLLGQVPVLDGLKEGGILLANWSRGPEELRDRLRASAHRVAAIDATAIAQETIGQPIPNTVLLGALARVSALVRWEALEDELHALFSSRGAPLVEANVRAARHGYEQVKLLAASGEAASAPRAPQASLPGWGGLAPGGLTRPAGADQAPATGSWRTQRPVLQAERCIHCMFCWMHCPDSAILVRDGRVVGVDYEHCKGCGICARECPVKPTAIPMEPEDRLGGERRLARSA